MSTDFLDVLEAQLDAAARRRYAGHRAPRRLFGELAAAAVAVAAITLAVVVLSGRSETHSARTPQPAARSTPALGDRAQRAKVVVLMDHIQPALRIVRQLTGALGRPVPFQQDPVRGLGSTVILYAPGQGRAALEVSQFLTGIPRRLAALRVQPLDPVSARAAGTGAQVVVRAGRDNLVLPKDPAPVTFRDGFGAGCPTHPRPVGPGDVEAAMSSVLLAWPEDEGAVIASARTANGSPWQGLIERRCGSRTVDSTIVLGLELTRSPSHPPRVVLFVACDGDGRWVVWRSLRR